MGTRLLGWERCSWGTHSSAALTAGLSFWPGTACPATSNKIHFSLKIALSGQNQGPCHCPSCSTGTFFSDGQPTPPWESSFLCYKLSQVRHLYIRGFSEGKEGMFSSPQCSVTGASLSSPASWDGSGKVRTLVSVVSAGTTSPHKGPSAATAVMPDRLLIAP